MRVTRLLKGASARSLTSLGLEVTDLHSQFTSLHAAHVRLTSRYAMRELRDRRKNGDAAAEEPAPVVNDRDKLRELARSRGLLR